MRIPMKALILSAGVAAVLGGCQSQQTAASLATTDYRLRHPILITEQPETLDLPVAPGTRQLSRDYTSRIAAFGSQARASGAGSVEILVPSGAATESAGHALAPQIRSALAKGGVPARSISTSSYPVGDPSAAAPIRIGYSRVKASAGTCGHWPDNLGGGIGANVDNYNFGCATQSNLAAMVANPADLLGPRPQGAADQNRRAVVFAKYRNGERTASEYKEGVGAQISNVGGGN
ncbi:pilus assembly protein [Microvirga tunisiensis]|uniref:Pilus assembly protein n=2 Tax=Pannonibacter tanglangensis TaxID=2750084 RepID=A0A7X5F5I7_9HYPH|nr:MULTISPECIES: CpaD family pilus assembly protein [unclassified Pannonibacter]NBN64660.1 pilus assembly protein [Pannonibacter sp. XCT-34]NBN79195.1 pilus assembly protein [Pannonibacter sp. XCT-53]